MMRNLILAAGAMAAVLAAAPRTPAKAPPTPRPSVDRLAWLAGCWERVEGERHLEEQWMKPRGGSMIGMSRTVVAGKTTEFESMWIREEGGRLVFTAHPSGQMVAAFPAVEMTDTEVVFADPDHDFPQKIRYRRQPDGSLLARIEGMMGMQMQMVEFPMSRTKCE